MGGKATTFFFTNYPERWSEKMLWDRFKKHGRLIDVFVAKKRNK